MIEVRAPGKLFIAGEYAVIEPGQPSVLVAVDRYLTVRLTESVGAGTIHADEYDGIPLVWTRGTHGLTVDRGTHPYEYVVSVLGLVERLRTELGLPPRFFDLRIFSELDDVSGQKFGLGSSAAITVATVAALDRFFGLGLSLRERFTLALLATIGIDPAASGGDLAASTYGGWIRYRAPDRDALRRRLASHTVTETIADAGEHFEVTRLAAPDRLRLLVGWTGSPASTRRLVSEVQRHIRGVGRNGTSFLAESRARVDVLVSGLETGDDLLALDAIRGARRLLRGLGERAGIAIETERLSALCDSAEAAGAAAKPSGAGGGDCGIVLAPESADVPAMLRAWETHDIRHLAISVHPPEGGADDD